MLQRLRIKNFQAHKDLKIKFDGCVTTIVGKTDTGKSSILRALYWLCFNKPSGDAFIKSGEKQTKVCLWIDNHKIIRNRGAKNFYKLDGRTLKSFGSNVPEPVKAILGLEPENFQRQLDSPFWLTLSSVQVSRELNQIVDLSLLDNLMTFLSKKCRRTKTKCELIKERVQEARKQKKKLSFALIMHKELSHIEKLQKRSTTITNKVSSLEYTIKKIKDQKENSKGLLKISTKGREESQKISILKKEGIEVEMKFNSLQLLLTQSDDLVDANHKSTTQLNKAKKHLEKEMVGKCPVCQKEL